MDNYDSKVQQLTLEREKLELKHLRNSINTSFIQKNLGSIITSLISIATISVTLAQIQVAKINKEKEHEISVTQMRLAHLNGAQQLKLKELEQERRWKFDTVNFTSKNMDLIYSKNREERVRIRNIMLIAFPLEITDELFKKIESTVQKQEDKSIWQEGQNTISRLNISRWNGSWRYAFNSKKGLLSGTMKLIVSEDLSVTGKSNFIKNGKVLIATLKGQLSRDTFRLEGVWNNETGQKGNLVFKISDNGESFSGSYSVSLNVAAEDNLLNTWKGTKIKEVEIALNIKS